MLALLGLLPDLETMDLSEPDQQHLPGLKAELDELECRKGSLIAETQEDLDQVQQLEANNSALKGLLTMLGGGGGGGRGAPALTPEPPEPRLSSGLSPPQCDREELPGMDHQRLLELREEQASLQARSDELDFRHPKMAKGTNQISQQNDQIETTNAALREMLGASQAGQGPVLSAELLSLLGCGSDPVPPALTRFVVTACGGCVCSR